MRDTPVYSADSTTDSHTMEEFAYPAQSPVNYTRVDFTPFLPLKAKIDCMTFWCKPEDLAYSALQALRQQMKQGVLEVPKDRRRINEHGNAWMTIHNPSLRDLRILVERFWNSRVQYIEFAVDAKLPPGSNDLHLLKVLKAQLRHCLHPQDHARLNGGKRKYYDLGLKRYKSDGLGTKMPDTQIIWEKSGVDDQVGLYIKEVDAHEQIGQPWVRMEARLGASGCWKAGLHKLGMLPNMAAGFRGYLAPMLSVGCGFKNANELTGKGVPSDPWAAYGAQWDGSGKARIKPDTCANRLIGSALNELRKSMRSLDPPSAVKAYYADWIYRASP